MNASEQLGSVLGKRRARLEHETVTASDDRGEPAESTRPTVVCAIGRPASRLTRAATALALVALAVDRPAGAGPGPGPGLYLRSMECVKVFDDRWRRDFR